MNHIQIRFKYFINRRMLQECLAYLEDGLLALASSPYHKIIGRNFLHHSRELAAWLVDFRSKTEAAGLDVRVCYVEMNGFMINPGEWHCDLFGYKLIGPKRDLSWLAHHDASNEESFVLTGMEEVQKAYSELFLDDSQSLGSRIAEEITSHIVTVRFMQLVMAAHEIAMKQNSSLSIPIVATAHDWSTAYWSDDLGPRRNKL